MVNFFPRLIVLLMAGHIAFAGSGSARPRGKASGTGMIQRLCRRAALAGAGRPRPGWQP